MTFEWPVDRTSFPPLPEPGDPPSAEYTQAAMEQDSAAQLAVTVLWALSGRQFGIQTVTARPCRVPLHSEYRGDSAVTSYVVSWEPGLGGWINLGCGCAGACNRIGPNMVHLPGPVDHVDKVEIAGEPLPSNVWVLEGNVLYRREGPWPKQDLNRPLGDVGTWGVTYGRGLPVPPDVVRLTGVLAAEFIAALSNKGQCRLPRTVTTASRQGVTYRAYDPAAIYANGKTGLPEIDLWLASINPHHLMAAPTVR